MTRAGEVYAALLTDLRNGEFAPAQKLRLVEIATRFGVSQSVVREVLTRLAEQGFVVATPQRGFRVRDLTVADITSLTETQVHVESVALRLAIGRGDMHWETRLLAAHHLLTQTVFLTDDHCVSEEWAYRHREFHHALLAGCINPRLETITRELRDNAELYQRWCWKLGVSRPDDDATEHRKLKDLALERDANGAVELLAKHIERAPHGLITYLNEREA